MSATPNLALPYILASQNQKEVTANADSLGVDRALCEQTSFDMADADVVLTLDQARQAMSFKLTGTNSADRNLVVPVEIKRPYIVRNETDGGFDVAVSAPGSPAGVTVTVPNSESRLLYCDGIDVIDVAGAGSSGPTFVDAEAVGVSGTTFTLAHAPN